MESNIDIKELWNRQAVPAADQSEILNKISRFRKSGLKKGIFLDVILVLTILFMIFIWIYFKPQFLSTKIGIIVGILPMCIVVVVNRKITSLYRSLDEKQSNIDYLNNLLMLKGKETFMQTKVMSLYFILLSFGILLYMYEYTLNSSFTFRLIAYSVLFLWIALNWFILRPVMIKKNRRKMDCLIRQIEKIKSQVDEF